MAGETEVPVVLRLFAQKTSSVNSVLQETKKGFNDLAGEVSSVAKSAALLSGSFTAALGGIVGAAVNVAGQFEQLQAKLTSTLGSSEAAARSFQRALEFAASTPFDVQGIVQATVQITAFGQSAERILPLAANLAAAFSERVQDVGQILGKAFSGSLEGFESLRNRLGISNILLAKFGAELTKTGGISITTSASLGKAQDALEKIIRTRFGDATSRQAATLFGAISNLGDAIQRTAAAFGSTLIPIVSTVTRTLTKAVEVFESLSPATRQIISLSALAAVGLGALATAASVLIAAVTTGLGGLVSFAGAIGALGGATGAGAAAAGLTTLAGSVSSLAGVAGAAGSGFLALLGPVGAIVALLGGVGLIALKNYEASTSKLDAAIVAEARSLVDARNAFTDYRDTIEQVTNSQGKLAASSGSVSDLAQALRVAFSNVTPADFLANAEKAGVTLESLGKDTEKNASSVKLMRDRTNELQEGLRVLNQQGASAIGAFTPENEAIIARTKDLLGGVTPTVENVNAALVRGDTVLNKLLLTATQIAGFRQEIQKTSPVFDEITKKAGELQDFLKFATKTDDVQVLRATFGQLETAIGDAEKKLESLKVPYGSLVELQQRLLTGSTQEKAAIEALLGLRDAQDNIDKKLQADEKKRIDEKIRLEEAGIERTKILKGESKAAEIKIYQELLGIVEKGSQEELSLLTKIANAKQALKREEVAAAKKVAADAKQTLDVLAGSSNAGLETLRATGTATANETSKALKSVLADLDAWAVKNEKLIQQNPQLAEDFKKTRAGFQQKFDTSELEKPKELLKQAITAAKEFGTEAVTNAQKQEAAGRGLAVLQKLQDSGTIKTTAEKAALQVEINRLKKEELTTSAAVTKEQDSQARLTAGVKRDGLSQEIALLKQQQEIQGKTPFLANQIADKEKQLLAERVQAIRDQEQQEIDAGATKAQAQERTQLRITQLQAEEVSKRISAEQNATSAFAAELQKRKAEEDRFRQQRQGGPNSPLISLGELSATSGFLGNFSLGQFNQGPSSPNFGGGQPPQAQLARVRATVANDLRQGEALAGRGTVPNALSAQINERQRLEAQAQGGALSGGGGGNISVNINGNAVDKPGIKALTKEAMKELVQDVQLRGGFGA